MTNNNISKEVAIVGGIGFVGSFLQDNLDKKNIKYKILDIKSNESNKNSIFADVTDITSLERIGTVDTIINLAAEHRDDVKPISRYDDVNINGAKNICQIARKYGVNNIIFTSSVAIYGFAKPNTDEAGSPNYFNDYGRTKYLAEQEYIRWYKEDPTERKLVIIRPTVIFGPGNRGNVFNLLNQIHKKLFVMIGSGKNIKSMAYVENVSEFISASLNLHKGYHVFNYIDKPDYDMNQLVRLTRNKLFKKNNVGIRVPYFIGKLLGYTADFLSRILKFNLPISSVRVTKFTKTTQFSSSQDTRWFKAPYTIKEGLNKTLEYEFIEDNSNKPTYKTE